MRARDCLRVRVFVRAWVRSFVACWVRACHCIGARAWVRVCLGLYRCACWVCACVRVLLGARAFVGAIGAFVGVRYHAREFGKHSKINGLARFYHALYYAWIMYRIILEIMPDNAGLSQN